MPDFNSATRVTAANAKQDGISLDMGNWFVQGIGNSIGAFVDLLGPPLDANATGEENADRWTNIITSHAVHRLQAEFFGWMFNRPAGNFGEYTEMGLSAGGSGSMPRPGAPLVKGKLRFIRRRPADAENTTPAETQLRVLRLSLFLNPTRFLRHQQIPPRRMLANPPQHWQLGEASIRTQELPRRRRASDEGPDDKPEISFDGNDNVLLDPSALSFARAEAWPLHLRRYLDAIEAELGREFQRAAINLHIGEGHVRANIPRTPDYALKEVETYFEFSHRNPLKLMRRLRPILESMVETYRTRVFKVLRAEADNDRDSPRVLLTLAGGRQLRIYAKTNKRVRFEVIHDVTNPSVNRLLHEDRGGYTTESRDELLGWFSRLAHDAADKINHMLSLLQDRIQIPSNSANTYELISGIFSTVRNVQRANDVVRLLVEEGSLRVNRRGSDYMLEIEQLRRKDILQNENGANTVTPPYRTALDELRRQANLPPLYGRRQSRRRRST